MHRARYKGGETHMEPYSTLEKLCAFLFPLDDVAGLRRESKRDGIWSTREIEIGN